MEKVENCISFILGKASQAVSRRARELLSPFQITAVQYAVLKAISDSEPTTASDLSERLVIDTATITGVIDRLEGNKWVARKAHKTDRRINLVSLTPKAKKQLPAMDQAMDLLNEEVRAMIGGKSAAVWQGLASVNALKKG